ncbi:MAG: hypothetical protein ACTH8F_00305 [Microbacterium sp.]|uniref:hypothetical protein n=1 Tax=Microbacterium sp. TaxID=51671 RepID=UPI003F9AD570
MSSDVTVGLIRALVEHMEYAPDEWASLVMVLEFDHEKVNGVSGFAYSAEGQDSAVTASPYEIRSAVKAYTDSYFTPGESLPVSLLVQFDRTKGKYEVTFEDTDEERWKLTPTTFATLPETLRPKFD